MERGFTLLELVVGLAITAVVAMAALPNMQNFYNEYQLRAFAINIKSFFDKARQESLERRHDLTIRYQKTTEQAVKGRLLLLQSLSAGELLLSSLEEEQIEMQPTWDSIVFDGRTGRVKENGHLRFSVKGRPELSMKLISHHATGRVRICMFERPFYEFSQC